MPNITGVTFEELELVPKRTPRRSSWLTMLAEVTDFHPVMLLVTARQETEGDAWTFRLHVERNHGHRLTELRLAPCLRGQ